jgi:hypothetical protein
LVTLLSIWLLLAVVQEVITMLVVEVRVVIAPLFLTSHLVAAHLLKRL